MIKELILSGANVFSGQGVQPADLRLQSAIVEHGAHPSLNQAPLIETAQAESTSPLSEQELRFVQSLIDLQLNIDADPALGVMMQKISENSGEHFSVFRNGEYKEVRYHPDGLDSPEKVIFTRNVTPVEEFEGEEYSRYKEEIYVVLGENLTIDGPLVDGAVFSDPWSTKDSAVRYFKVPDELLPDDLWMPVDNPELTPDSIITQAIEESENFSLPIFEYVVEARSDGQLRVIIADIRLSSGIASQESPSTSPQA